MVLPIHVLYFTSLLFFLAIVGTPFFIFDTKTVPLGDEPQQIHGNFLHITDFHPDPHYVSNVTARSRCHDHFEINKRPKHMKKGISGPWGAPATVCDSPLSLIDATFEWLEKNWNNKIDFVIWTGDNARHDNDDNIPRSPDEIFQLNRMIAEKFLKAFGDTKNFKNKRGPHFIPIIPSIGNNDLHPNNIILPGPNNILTILHDIWSPFIPKGQHKNFLNGGYFYSEVIPKKLMVVSLNTLYFYKANTAVNGCKDKNQPGSIQMKWLNGVLKYAKKNGIKVYLTGHVGPRAKQYTKSCYISYGRLALYYHDIILGHFYGHSNMDHFFFISKKSIRKRGRRYHIFMNDNDDEFDEFEEDDYDDDDYNYDDDDDDDDNDDDDYDYDNDDDSYDNDDNDHDGKVETNVYNIDRYMNKLLRHYSKILPRSKNSEKEYAVVHINPSIIPTFFPALRIFKYNTTEVTKRNTTIDDQDHSDAPSHINTFLTPLGYTQYFINLTHANLYPNITPEYTIEYTTWDDYRMDDLTVPSWIQLARKIVNRGFRSSLWKKIQEHLMVGARSLIRQKSKRHYRYSESREKGPEDYITSELSF